MASMAHKTNVAPTVRKRKLTGELRLAQSAVAFCPAPWKTHLQIAVRPRCGSTRGGTRQLNYRTFWLLAGLPNRAPWEAAYCDEGTPGRIGPPNTTSSKMAS